MGGRGGASGIAPQRQQRTQPKIKTSAEQSRIIDFVNTQINVDLNQYRDDFTARFESPNSVLVYWKDIPATVKQEIYNLQNQYGGRIQLDDMGAWGKTIRLRRKR